MKAKHTPAPWTYVEGFLEQDKIVYDYWVRGADKDGICEIGRKHNHVAEANARLIASAPELLEALKAEEAHQQAMRNFESISDPLDERLLGFRNEVDRTRSIANRLRKEAIAKAEGE
jgi:hypothetical protein